MKSMSDVLLQIVDSIRKSGISTACQSLFGKDMKFIVGGYAQKLANDDDAPFCLVMCENSESAVNSNKLISFSAKIIIGICPMRDVPSTASVDKDISNASTFIGNILSRQADLKSVLTDESDISFMEDVIERCTSFQSAFNSSVSSAASSKDSEDYSSVITNYETAFANDESFCTCTKEIFDRTWVDVEGKPAQAKIDAMYDAWEHYMLITTPGGINDFRRDVSNLRNDFDAYIDDPFIKQVDSNGVEIYGAQKIMDDLREKVVNSLSEIEVGMITDSITVNCSSVSHYPLEWCEIVLSMSCPESLGDSVLNG